MRILVISLFCVAAANAQIVSMSIGTPVFSGSGLNDASVTGGYVGLRANHDYTITVASTGTPDSVNYLRDGIDLIGPYSMTSTPQPIYYGAGFITGASWSGGVVTFTDAGHGIATGTLVTVSGVTPTGYNVTLLPATVIDSSHFSVPVASNPGAWTSGGVATGNDGLSVQWAATTGHTPGDEWQVLATGNTATPSYLARLVGATVRGLQDKLTDEVNLKDFGAVGDGVADDTPKVQSALDNAPDGATIRANKGEYRLTKSSGTELLLMHKAQKLACDPGAQFVVDSGVPGTIDVLRIHGPGPLVGFSVDGCQFIPESGTPARDGIVLDATSSFDGSNFLTRFLIQNNWVGPFGRHGVATLFPGSFSDGIFNGQITNNTLIATADAAHLEQSGDTIDVSNNGLEGTLGVYLSSVTGAGSNVISHNSIVACAPIVSPYSHALRVEFNNLEPTGGCSVFGTQHAVVEIGTDHSRTTINPRFIGNEVNEQPCGAGQILMGEYIDGVTGGQFDDTVTACAASQIGYLMTALSSYNSGRVWQSTGVVTTYLAVQDYGFANQIDDASQNPATRVSAARDYNYSKAGVTQRQIVAGSGQGNTPLVVVYRAFRDDAVFTGSGVNDLIASGIFTGSADETYCVQITAAGSPDTIEWGIDNCATFPHTGVALAPVVNLDNGISIVMGSTTGHTTGDHWTIIARTVNSEANIIYALGADGTITLAGGYNAVNGSTSLPVVTMSKSGDSYVTIGPGRPGENPTTGLGGVVILCFDGSTVSECARFNSFGQLLVHESSPVGSEAVGINGSVDATSFVMGGATVVGPGRVGTFGAGTTVAGYAPAKATVNTGSNVANITCSSSSTSTAVPPGGGTPAITTTTTCSDTGHVHTQN